ncbi:MAG TPA: DUF2948 family protein, partial [Stellaceae bacterium]|nr:DUF2948 family protein [Stellaceae bacterium]
ISAILQDALVTVGEMVYLPDQSQFVLVANRFRWEPAQPETRSNHERILSGFCVDTVKSVRRRGFNPREQERILVLLAIRTDSFEEPTALILEFAGGSSIWLEVGRIMCHLDDLGEPWPTRWRPKHPVAESD